MSTGPGHSNEYFDMDQLSERPDSGRPDSVKLSSDKRGPGSIAESARTGSERRGPASHRLGSERRGPGSIAESTRTGSERQGPPSRQMSFSKRKRPGRPPAVLSAIPLPQMLAPISHKTEVSGWIHIQGRQKCQNYFASLLKGVYSKRKEFAPLGSQIFPFRVDTFSDRLNMLECKQKLTKIISFEINGRYLPSVPISI